jgi:hypothetical protein
MLDGVANSKKLTGNFPCHDGHLHPADVDQQTYRMRRQ